MTVLPAPADTLDTIRIGPINARLVPCGLEVPDASKRVRSHPIACASSLDNSRLCNKSWHGEEKEYHGSKKEEAESNGSPTEDALQQSELGKLVQLQNKSRGRPVSRVLKPAEFKAGVAHVSQKTIAAKWSTLDPSAQRAIEQLLLGVHVPVLAKFKSEPSKADAQTMLEGIRTSLYNRLPKTPFPPRTTEKDFSPGTLQQHNQVTQQRLDDVESAMRSLKEEVENQRQDLRNEKRSIKRLERVVQDLENEQSASKYLSPSNTDRDIDDLPHHINLVEQSLS